MYSREQIKGGAEKSGRARISTSKGRSCQVKGRIFEALFGEGWGGGLRKLAASRPQNYNKVITRCGISAKQLERELGVTYKTAWRMFNQIRKLLAEDTGQLVGEVEMDETYYGGRRRGTPRGRPGANSHKVPIVGAVERGGKVAALVTRDASRASIMPIVQEYIMPASMIYTDEWTAYDGVKKAGYQHKRVPHAEKVYVIGRVHVNTIEGFWSLLKRGISGVYHSVSAKHLQSYVNEYSYRYNHRGDERPMFESITEQVGRVRHGRYGEYAPIG